MTDEIPVQEVRYCLKTLREQMAARQNNNNTISINASEVQADVNGSNDVLNSNFYSFPVPPRICKVKDYKELTEIRDLYSYMEETEKLERSRLQRAETKVEEQQKKMTEMQMHMDSLKLQNATLQEKLSANETELEKLRKSDDKCEELKKDLEIQQYKNRSLDDMLKSQQRKVRNMIEQVQNARILIDNRSTQVSDLKEKVSFLEAENKELHDRLCHVDKQEQRINIPDKGFLSPGKKPFMLARIKN
nr:Si:dkey-204a24.6 protein [Danio rerio]